MNIQTPPRHFEMNIRRNLCHAVLVLSSLFVLVAASGCNVAADRANTKGRQFFDSGQYAQAINEFQTALNRNPGNSNALYNMGSTLYAMGKQQQNRQWLEQAEQMFRQSIATQTQNPDAHRSLAALLIENGRGNSAFELINNWMQQNPGSPDPPIELARLYQEHGDNRRAVDLLTDALRIDTDNIRALKAMGFVRELQGEKSLALRNYLRVLQNDNQQTDVIERVAWLQNSLQSALPTNVAQVPGLAIQTPTPLTAPLNNGVSAPNSYQSPVRLGQAPTPVAQSIVAQPNSSYSATPTFGSPTMVAVNRTQAIPNLVPNSSNGQNNAGPARYGAIDPYLNR